MTLGHARHEGVVRPLDRGRSGTALLVAALIGSPMLGACRGHETLTTPAPGATVSRGQGTSPTEPGSPPAPAAPALPTATTAPSDSALGKAPLGADSEPLLRDAELSFAEGTSECTPEVREGSACGQDQREKAECTVFELRRCGEQCEGYASRAFECVRGAWKASSATEPPCACTPKAPRDALAECTTRLIRTLPSRSTALNHCQLVVRCGQDDMLAECDAEEDGTGTSLCDCWRNRKAVQLPKGLFSSEGPEACFEAASLCVAAK